MYNTSTDVQLTIFGVETIRFRCKEGKELIFKIGKRPIENTGDKKTKINLYNN